MIPDRRGSRNAAPIPRKRETSSRLSGINKPTLNHELGLSKDSGRKRRLDDSFEEPPRKSTSSKDKAKVPGKQQSKRLDVPSKAGEEPLALNLKKTNSDALANSLRAKQGVLSPDYTKERPFRLNLSKRSKTCLLDRVNVSEIPPAKNSLGTGSSAKKSLNFDALPPEDEEWKSREAVDPCLVQNSQPTEQSWYEQTVEEEEALAQKAMLETRFSNSIRIEDDNMVIPENSAIDNNGVEIENEEAWEDEEYMEEDGIDDESHQEALEKGDMDWEEYLDEEERVDLEWEAEDDAAYQEIEKSLLEAGETLENDDLLGEEFDDFENRDTWNVEKQKERDATLNQMGLGHSKQKGKKKEKQKKASAIIPQAQTSQANSQGAASRKLFNLQGKFSPKTQGPLPHVTRTNVRQPRASGRGPSTEVFPSSVKNKTSSSIIDTGGPSNPPGSYI